MGSDITRVKIDFHRMFMVSECEFTRRRTHPFKIRCGRSIACSLARSFARVCVYFGYLFAEYFDGFVHV